MHAVSLWVDSVLQCGEELHRLRRLAKQQLKAHVHVTHGL